MARKTKKIFLLLLFVIIITPLGILTNYTAWGEWDVAYFKKVLGFIPVGIQKASNLFAPLLPGYQVAGKSKIFSQYLSALIGVVIIFLFFYLVRFILRAVKSSGKRK